MQSATNRAQVLQPFIEFICCAGRELRRTMVLVRSDAIQTHGTNTIPKFFCRSGNRVCLLDAGGPFSRSPKLPNDTSRLPAHISGPSPCSIRYVDRKHITSIGHYYDITDLILCEKRRSKSLLSDSCTHLAPVCSLSSGSSSSPHSSSKCRPSVMKVKWRLKSRTMIT